MLAFISEARLSRTRSSSCIFHLFDRSPSIVHSLYI